MCHNRMGLHGLLTGIPLPFSSFKVLAAMHNDIYKESNHIPSERQALLLILIMQAQRYPSWEMGTLTVFT
jgi:hypothetical protein